MNPGDLDAMLDDARRLGLDDRGRLLDHLRMMVQENLDYLEYRQSKRRTGAYNTTVARNTAALAMAIKLLSES